MKKVFNQKIICVLIVTFIGAALFFSFDAHAAQLKTTFPRTANYFLKWEISDSEARELAKWDVLILDMEVQENSRQQLLKIRELNPSVVILAYINGVEQVDNADDYNKAELRQRLARNIDSSWWLRDSRGNKISNWPYNSMLNLTDSAPVNSGGKRYNDYLPNFVVNEIKATGLWDGVYYDNTWGDISWLNAGNIDANNDGEPDNSVSLDQSWSNGFKKVLSKTRELAGRDFIIVGNGRVFDSYQGLLNGSMLESFPSSWENGGTWAGSMKTYLRLPSVNSSPNLSVLNVTNKNQVDYKRFRFGLASALMGNGFYSFDYDITNHGQTWWYDEYNLNLGAAQSDAYNLLNNRGTDIQAGLWRRDFKYGSAIVNSTNKEQLYVFQKEEMEKIKGVQDPAFNTGLKINYLKLAPQDGVLLLRQNAVISGSAFTNGYFYRVYDFSGKQIRTGFFSYLSNFPGEQEVVTTGQTINNQDMSLSAGFGVVYLQKNGSKLSTFPPYASAYKGRINLAAKIDQGVFKLVVTGPTNGGGPQVRMFLPDGKLLGNFFAYDKNSRGGVSVALGDVNGDGQDEIITSPGVGQEPLIKIFSVKGILINSFLAYDIKFKGGVSVAVGDTNGDDQIDIITAPGAGGGPHIRIFNSRGEVLSNFFAYDQSYHGGIKVSASDINDDGVVEILAGIKNFY
ncbi:MAG: putative glycoside hydrolase [Candidatus Falkowbacteria bacterium]